MNITKILGPKYGTLETAKVFVKPGQIIVTYNEKSFFIVKKDVYNQILFSLDYYAA